MVENQSETKTTVTEMKHTLEVIDSRVAHTEGQGRDLEGMGAIAQSKQQKEKLI